MHTAEKEIEREERTNTCQQTNVDIFLLLLYLIFILIWNWKGERHCLSSVYVESFYQIMDPLVELNRSNEWKISASFSYNIILSLMFLIFMARHSRHLALDSRQIHARANSCYKTWHSKIWSDLDIWSELIKVNACISDPVRKTGPSTSLMLFNDVDECEWRGHIHMHCKIKRLMKKRKKT